MRSIVRSVAALAACAALPALAVPGIDTTTLPPGVLGVPYPAGAPVLQASGGTSPYSFSIASGALPSGLILASSGAISGTPAALGSVSVTFLVTDALNATGTKALTLTVEPPPVHANWAPRGNDGGLINKVVLSPNYSYDRTLFTLNNLADLHRSIDRGATWTRFPVLDLSMNGNGMGYTAEQLLLSPVYDQTSNLNAEAQTLFVIGRYLGVYKSVDHGQTFRGAVSGLRGFNACTLPINCDLYFHAAAISPNYASDHTLLLVQKWNTDGLYHVMRTTDGGTTWSSLSTLPPTYNNAGLWTMAISPRFAVDQTVLVAMGGALLKSANGGISFTQIQNFTADELRFSPLYATDSAIMARSVVAGAGRILLSRDGGATFSTLATPKYIPGYLNVEWAIRSCCTPPRIVAYAQDWGYYRYRIVYSEDYGATFTPLPAWGLPVPKGWDPYYQVMWLAADIGSNSAFPDIFVATNSGLLASFDGGRLFAERTQGMGALDAYAADWQGSTAIVCCCDRILRSTDDGQNWSSLRVPSFSCTNYATNTQCLLSPNYAADRTIFYLDENGNLYRSTDAGRSFTGPVGVGYNFAKQMKIRRDFNPATGEVYIATNSGLMRSQDGGATFSAMTLPAACAASNHPGLALSPNFATDRTMFLSNYPSGSLCKSVDGGANWTVLGGALNSGDLAISPDYLESGANGTPQKTIFSANTGMSRVQRSTDGGATWSDVAGWPALGQLPAVPHPVLSPNYPLDGTLFIYYQDTLQRNSSYGIWRSGDFGATATQIGFGGGGDIYTRQVTGIAFAPYFDGRNSAPGASVAIATTQGGGIYRSNDGGRTFATANGYKFISRRVNAIARAASAAGSEPSPAIFVGTADEGIFRSIDEGTTFDNYSANLPARPFVNLVATPSPTGPALASVTDLDANTAALYGDTGNIWSYRVPGNFTDFRYDGTSIYAARSDGVSYRSTDNGLTWTMLSGSQTDLVKMDFNSQTTPTFWQPAAGRRGPFAPSGASAALWAVSASGGPRWSADSGASWTATPGSNDYTLPSGQSWTVIRALGINPVSNARDVIAGSAAGLWLSRNGGDTWKRVDGAGSGLETTSKNFSSVLSTVTATTPASTDILVGATGASNGGVYLSGDGGEHWTQVNQGFDPGNLSISSLVKTSCAGCPVQYYSGTFGNGIFTRTIAVNNPPAFPSASAACFGATSCACTTTGWSGPVYGGQPFKLCGSNFQSGAAVEFDGVAATGCARLDAATITCAGTPPHAAGYALVRVRNPDTRAGTLPANYQYLGGTSRADTLRVVKSGANAWVSWNCAGCTAGNPALLYRAQNAVFSLYLESYSGGASGTTTGGCTPAAGTTSCHNQTGAAGSAQSYFWSVE